jgi:hypothetical protein
VPDLFGSPVLIIEQPDSKVAYQITDGQGTPVARAGRVGSEEKAGSSGPSPATTCPGSSSR